MKHVLSFLLPVVLAALPARADDFASVETEAQELCALLSFGAMAFYIFRRNRLFKKSEDKQ